MKKFLLVIFVLAVAGCSTPPVGKSVILKKNVVREVPAKGVSK